MADHPRPRPTGEPLLGLPTSRRRRILVLSQVYVPDPAAGGQLAADACAELARRGHDVRVLTINRGYDDPAVRYPSRETRDGVRITRLSLSSFGKGSSLMRLLSGVAFTAQSAIRGVFGPRVDTVVVSSHPPMAPLAALAVARLKRADLVYWIMDLNPDQAVALGHFGPSSLPVKGLDWMQRAALSRAREVIVLDRFMADRVRAKSADVKRLTVIPPWPLKGESREIQRDTNPFRRRHAFGNRIAVMYSGNHGPSHPLRTLLAAATELRDDPRFVFAFVGGGVGKKDVDDVAGGNIVSLPYQPFETLHESLAAADVHAVTMGDDVVGINHPSKIYDALAAGRPILFVGPEHCHIADIFAEHKVGWHVRHGDVVGLRQALEEIAALPPDELRAMGRRAGQVVRTSFSSVELRNRLCDLIAPSVA
jgi:colanic acid biosynthesis glycosyl transferase WcaI